MSLPLADVGDKLHLGVWNCPRATPLRIANCRHALSFQCRTFGDSCRETACA
jgi:hypothetical protein